MKKEQVPIRDLTSTGEGVGTLEEKVVFVEGALPKEQVEIEVVVSKRTYSKAKLLRVLHASPHRIEPPCRYFGVCGGCQIQHTDQAMQHSLKEKKVVDALQKIGGIEKPLVKDCTPSAEAFGYRNKMTFPLLLQQGKKQVGFFQKRSHALVDVEHCMLHIPFADRVYRQIKALLLGSPLSFYDEKRGKGMLQHLVLRTSKKEQKVLVGLVGLQAKTKELEEVAKQIGALEDVLGVVYGKKAKASNSIYPDSEEVLVGEGVLSESLLGVSVEISLFSFFQVNTSVAEKLYQKAYEYGAPAKGEEVLDAYCGIGTFAIFLAQKGLKVTGIESFPKAVVDAKANAKRNGVEITFIEGEVEKISLEKSYETIFINTPRKGVHPEVIKSISRLSPKKIVYTSCDPATLARDVKMLLDVGYSFVEATPFDMFPQTMHVETVALLEKS